MHYTIMEKVYTPQGTEEEIYDRWMSQKAYAPDARPFAKQGAKSRAKKRFTIMLPPPNVTGNLHIGHALAFTLEDALVRYKKIQGIKTLWLPGYDHASIATQVIVEKELRKKGITRHQLGREKFIEEVWNWIGVYKKNIEGQLKRLGALPDWERARFTFDPAYQESVTEAFLRLYKKGLIYRGERMINWCPRCQTVLSDIEVEYRQESTKLYYIHYGPITVATVRPEPIPGDTAIAVHPRDKRYKKYIGETVPHPLNGRMLPIIADSAVDPAFGTGAIKVTPAHDPLDFELAQKYALEILPVIGFDGKMTQNVEKYAGLSLKDAREAILSDLQQKGAIEKVVDYEHAKGHCSRCDTPVEPLVSKQWFIKMKPLAEPVINAAQRGEVKFTPPRFKKVFLHWLTNIEDWCISRQLWWGQQLPVYYCTREAEVKSEKVKVKSKKFVVSKEKPKKCPFCGKCEMKQDYDVLDTWFSSGLWPFATLGWPQNTQDFKTFYPTDALQTGYDILFFWVAKMLMLGKNLTGKLPFTQVYLDGLVRDRQGRKMSKSLGNVIDPLTIIDEYGADALRFALLYGLSAGNDMKFDASHLTGGRNFANKLWNIGRFAKSKVPSERREGAAEAECSKFKVTVQNVKRIKKDTADKQFLAKLSRVEKEVERHMERYQLAQALQKLHNFVWHELADKYLEQVKKTDTPEKLLIFNFALLTLLRLLHPFMPFVTQRILDELKNTYGA